MMKNRTLIKRLLLALCMTGLGAVHAAEVPGLLYMPTSQIPAELIGHLPGIQVSVKTDNHLNDGYIYTGNTLTLSYKVLDSDLDWADPITQQEIEDNIYWYYVEPDGNGNYVPVGDGEPMQKGGSTYNVQPDDVGKIVGISIFAKTTTGTPKQSKRLEVFDLRDTYTLVPEGQEDQFGGQPPGTVFKVGKVEDDNNIDDVVIRACPAGETCGGLLGRPKDIDFVLYQNVAAPGEAYDYREISITEANQDLRVKTWYALKVFAMKPDPANPDQLIRSDVDMTEFYQDKIEWVLVDPTNTGNKQVVNARYNPVRKHLQFKTQEFNDNQSFTLDDNQGGDGSTVQASSAGNVQSDLHQSQQGMKFQFMVDY